MGSIAAATLLALGTAGGVAAGAEPIPAPLPGGAPGVVVARPVPRFLQPKTFYLSNYAGAPYPRLRSRVALTPATGWFRPGGRFGRVRDDR